VGQGSEISVPISPGAPTADELRSSFEERYRTLFGRTIPNAAIEILSWQLRVSRQTWHEAGPVASTVTAPPGLVPLGERDVFDFRIAGWTTYHVYERRTLAPGTRLRGPALVVEDDTTTVVPTSFSARACPSRP